MMKSTKSEIVKKTVSGTLLRDLNKVAKVLHMYKATSRQLEDIVFKAFEQDMLGWLVQRSQSPRRVANAIEIIVLKGANFSERLERLSRMERDQILKKYAGPFLTEYLRWRSPTDTSVSGASTDEVSTSSESSIDLTINEDLNYMSPSTTEVLAAAKLEELMTSIQDYGQCPVTTSGSMGMSDNQLSCLMIMQDKSTFDCSCGSWMCTHCDYRSREDLHGSPLSELSLPVTISLSPGTLSSQISRHLSDESTKKSK